MAQLPPACPRCRSSDAALLSLKEGFLNDPPEPGEEPVATVAVFLCECGHVFTDVQRPTSVKRGTPELAPASPP